MKPKNKKKKNLLLAPTLIQKENKALIFYFLFFAGIFMVDFLFVLGSFIKNIKLAYPHELLIIALFSILNSFLIFFLFLYFFKKNYFFGAIGAFAFIYLLSFRITDTPQKLKNIKIINTFWDYLLELQKTRTIKAIFPNEDLFIVGILGLFIFFFTFFLIKLFSRYQISKDIYLTLFKASLIVITVIFLLKALTTTRVIVLNWPQYSYKPPQLEVILTEREKKPDIFYIVFDRYTNFGNLKNILGFSDDEFLNFLKKEGFYVNENASSYFSSTGPSIASTLRADYLKDIMENFENTPFYTHIPFLNSARNSPVIKAIKSQGYKYYLFGNWYMTSNTSPLADRIANREEIIFFNYKIPFDAFTRYFYRNFIFNKIFKKIFPLFPSKIIKATTECEHTASNIEDFEQFIQEDSGGRLVFAHFLTTHPPFCFSLDENFQNKTEGEKNPKLEKYLTQVKFTNKKLKEWIKTIKEKSQGQAIIIILSDEGTHPCDDLGECQVSENENLQLRFGVLSAHYLPGVTKEEFQKAGDSVNIFRLVLNKYFGADLPYLPKRPSSYED